MADKATGLYKRRLAKNQPDKYKILDQRANNDMNNMERCLND